MFHDICVVVKGVCIRLSKSSDFCFTPKLNLGLDTLNFFPTSESFIPMSSKISTVFLYDPIHGYITGISVDTKMKDPKKDPRMPLRNFKPALL